MRLIIAGSRDFNDIFTVRRVMHQLPWKIKSVVCGCARGADKLGEQWATEQGITVIRFPADWDLYGKAAGPIRNTLMAENADALIAFWDGQSSGTKHMISVARAKKLKVMVYNYILEELTYQ